MVFCLHFQHQDFFRTPPIALSFYIPAVLGSIYIFPVVLCYFLTDLFLGIHQVVFFTWGSIILIGVLSKYFIKSFYTRIMGSFFGACLFFLLTNFGVWVTGMYEYSINGLITSYILALPFFYHTIVSTIFFSLIIEFILRIFNFGKLNSFYSNIKCLRARFFYPNN